MLSGEGNSGERWKTTIGLISQKKATLHVQHTFFVHFFAVVFTTTKWNFQKLLSHTCYGGNIIHVLVPFFSVLLIFTLQWWRLAFLILSPSQQNFHVVLSTKNCLIHFLSLALDLCRPLSRWACRLLSLFLCLSPALYSKFADMTINLS